MSEKEYRLSRLDFINNVITPATPNIVIYEIATAHGCPLTFEQANYQNEELIRSLYEKPIKVVREPITREGWRYIARYINPEVVTWKDGYKLREAFNFLWQLRRLELSSISLDFKAGGQNPDQPFSLNACVMYGFCLKHHLLTWPEMSYQELAFAVKSLLVPPSFLLNHFFSFVQQQENPDFINTCLYYMKQNKTPLTLPSFLETNYDNLDGAYEFLADLSTLQEYYYPRQPIEAIALVACKYFLDISSSKYPFEELTRLRSQGERYYQPFDPIMAKYYAINPQLYSLAYHFNPLFPEKYYPGAFLDNLLQNSGYPFEHRVSSYSQLVEAYLCNSFYHGLRPGIKNLQSPFDLDNITEVESNSVLCYGTPLDGFTFLTYSELADFFRFNKAFLHPLMPRTTLERYEINRLRILAGEDILPYDTPTSQGNRKKLYQALAYVDAFNGEIEESLRLFLIGFEQASDEVKERIKGAITKLFYLTMYLRGWFGPDENYPIAEAPYRPSHEVFIRVTQALSEWKQYLEEMGPEWSERINNLPLVRYHSNSEGFGLVASTEASIGRTIGEKIAIIEQGEDHNNVMGSCIRVSSNWLAGTVYRYMCLLGMIPPFQITDLSYIT